MNIATFDELELPDDAIVIVDEALPAAWIDALPDAICVAAGEGLKRLDAIEELAGRVLERRSTRPLTLVGVGGGSIGDAVGFLASVLWRGVDLWHVPTTLLAMVDSAHGGKTAVNLGEAKNQLGTFYPAERVVLVDEALATLPLEQRRDGLAELVKGLWLGDAAALDLLEADGGVDALAAAPFAEVGPRLMELLERAIAVKHDIVERDLHETKGIRTVLNLGHTVAHTLELNCGVSHGQAVCWGMLAMSFLSVWRAGLSEAQARRLRRHVYALMTPARAVGALDERERFCGGIARDKKRVDGQLRSVLLDAPAEPLVTREVSAGDWFEAHTAAVEWFETTPARLGRSIDRRATLDVDASKSEMNRALVIAHLRPGETSVAGDSSADDVGWLRSCLVALERADGPVHLWCGEGGTTFRFLLALAAAREGETTLLAEPRLLQRPHEPLIDALRAAGADIEPIEVDGQSGLRVRGWSGPPERLSVAAQDSSQFASALALLAAAGRPFELELAGHAPMASRPYFDMTLAFLKEAGVTVNSPPTRCHVGGSATGAGGPRSESAMQSNPALLCFEPTDALDEPLTLRAETDASSAAVWAAASLVGVDATLTRPPTSERQPDARASELVERLRIADRDGVERVEIDLGESPDLAPVLCAAAVQLRPRVDLVGAAHLRHKESDRIGDLVAAFDSVGVKVLAREDGLTIPAGTQAPTPGARWPTFGDHRLAMAALITSCAGDLVVEAPMVVSKSYPNFWHHARQLGWSVVPVAEAS